MKITPRKLIKGSVPYGALVIHRRLKQRKDRIRSNQEAIDSALVGVKKINGSPRPKVVISLTTYGHRINHIAPLSIISLFKQTVMPDKIVLWLAYGEKPSKSLRKLLDFGLEIKYTKDIGSYKKLIPSLQEYPESTIITVDDDVLYPVDWLEKIILTANENPNTVVFNRGRQILINDGRVEEYAKWPLLELNLKNSSLMLPTGVGGVLYPKGSLDKRVFDEKSFISLAKHGDDVWFWAMTELSDTKRVMVEGGFANTLSYELDNQNSNRLSMINDNTKYINNMLSEFPMLTKRIGISSENKGFPGSAEYWEARYAAGDNSGAGSYNRLAKFKSEILNSFVEKNNINTIIEFGSGDGNQLLTAQYPNYIGFDVSKTAVELCRKMFSNDSTKRFYTLDKFKTQKADLTLSLDVLYHLIEQDIFEEHIKSLFKASKQYVIIYAHDGDEFAPADHVKSRNFTKYIAKNIKGWRLIKHVPNKYPYDPKRPNDTTWADFFIYKKLG